MNLRRHLRNRALIVLSCSMLATGLHACTSTAIAREPVVLDVAQIEDQIAKLAQIRDDQPAASRPFVDLAIDLRIVQRWMRQTAAADKLEPAFAHVLELRRRDLEQVIALVDVAIKTPPASANPAAAVAKLRAATFDLTDKASLADLDQSLAIVAKESAAALGVALPADMPAMRPTPKPTTAQPKPVSPVVPRAQTPAQIRAAIQQVTVSIPLRRQIAQLCDVVDQAKPEEKPKLTATLVQMFDMALALQRNTAVTPEVRQKLDEQMSLALALYNDARTRDSGSKRVAALVGYGQVSARIEALPLSREARQQLLPFFAYVRDAGPTGDALLDCLEQLLAAKLKLSQLPRATVPPQMRKAIDEVRASAMAQLDLSLGELEQVGGRGAFAATPDQVLQSAARSLELVGPVEALEQIDKTIATLNEFKPKAGPAAAPNSVERVLGVALVRLDDAQRAQAGQRTLTQATQLAEATKTLAAIDTSSLSTVVGRTYAGVTAEQFNVAWRSTVNQAYTQFIEKEAIEPVVFARLTGLAQAVDMLTQADEVETLLEKAALVNKWADWSVSRQSLGAARQPFAGALANAFDKLTRNEAADLDEVRAQLQSIQPIITIAKRVVDHADQVSTFPAEPANLFLRLATPSLDAPFPKLRELSSQYQQ
jgi:hypothetical protein